MMRMSPESAFIWLAFMARFLSSIIFFLENRRKMLFHNWGKRQIYASVSKDGPWILNELLIKNISDPTPGLRIRIPIGSGFNRVSGSHPYSESGSGSRRAKMTHNSIKILRNFMF
jgi:hypothetical protein